MWNVYRREWTGDEVITIFVAGYDLEQDAWDEAYRLDEAFPYRIEYHFVRYEND